MYRLTLFVLILFISCKLISQTRTVSTLYCKDYEVYFDLNEANKADPEKVEGLYVECNKIDSIGNQVAKFKNLKYLYIGKCYMSWSLDSKDRAYVRRRNEIGDSISYARAEREHYSVQPCSCWDSLLSENHIKFASKEFYELEKLEFVELMCKVDRKVKKKLLKLFEERKICVRFKDVFKCPTAKFFEED